MGQIQTRVVGDQLIITGPDGKEHAIPASTPPEGVQAFLGQLYPQQQQEVSPKSPLNVAQQLLAGLRNYVAGPHPMFDAAAQKAAEVAAKIQGIPSVPQAQASTGPFLRQTVGATAEAAAHPIKHADVTLPAATVAALAPLTAGEDLPVGLQALGAFLRLAGAGTAGYAGGNIAGKNPVDSAANAMIGQGAAELPGITGQLFQGLGKAGAYKNLTTTPAIRGSIMRQNPEILTNQSADKALVDMFLHSPGLAFKNEDAIVGELNDQFQNAVDRRKAALALGDKAGLTFDPRKAAVAPNINQLYTQATKSNAAANMGDIKNTVDDFLKPPITPGATPVRNNPTTGAPQFDPSDYRRYWDTTQLPPDQRFQVRPYSEGQTRLEGINSELDKYHNARAAAQAQGVSPGISDTSAATLSRLGSNTREQMRQPDISFLPQANRPDALKAAAENAAATDTMSNIYPLKEAVVKGTNADDAFNLRQRLSLGEGFLPKITQYLYHSPLSPSLGKARTLFEVGQNAQSPLLPALGRLSFLLAKGEPKDEPNQ